MTFKDQPGFPAMTRHGKRLNGMAKQTTAAFVALGEPESTSRVLSALLGHRHLRIEEVARRAGFVPVTARRILTDLERRGWVSAELLQSSRRGRRPTGYTLVVSRAAMLKHYQEHARLQATRRLKAAQSW